MLFVISAQPAVVGTSPLYGSVINQRHFRRLDEYFPAAAIIIDIISDQYPFRAVLGTSLQEIDLAILKYGLCLDFSKTLRANRHDHVIEKIRPFSVAHD